MYKDGLKSAGISECSDVNELLFDKSLNSNAKIGHLLCASGIDVKQLLRSSIIANIEQPDLMSPARDSGGHMFDLAVPLEIATATWRLSDLSGSKLWIWLCHKLLIIACDDHRDSERRLIALALVLRH